jgi:lipoprotein-releasing system permease protein
LYLSFAWRYFRAKKSANAINIIAWLSVVIIAFTTCAQVLVLSVFNGFEDLVKSLYASFYSDVKIIPSKGKTFTLSASQIQALKKQHFVVGISLIAEEKALIKNEETQTVVSLKGVDENYKNISGIVDKISAGVYDIGNADIPNIIVGLGVQNSTYINVSSNLPSSQVTIILPKKTVSTNIENAMSEGNATASAVFNIQQEIDNKYAITNIDFVKTQMGFAVDEFSAVEIKLIPNANSEIVKKELQNLLNNSNVIVQNRYEQNANLYSTMQLEKWAVFFILTLIIIIASFNIISVLTMLVLEKQKDISILHSMGTTKAAIQKIFLAEGLLLGCIGAACGIAMALIISFLQIKFHLIKLNGGSFLIDYFPVKLMISDFLLIAFTVIAISFIAAWFPANKASNKIIALK